MGIGAISWKMQINSMLKLIRVTGVALNDEDSQWVLECGIVEMLELAMKNNGAFVPLTDFPEIREKGILSTLKLYLRVDKILIITLTIVKCEKIKTH